MTHYESVQAQYTPTGVRAYDGNPLIEALPPLERSKDEILDRIEYTPPRFTKQDRRQGDLVRIGELSRLGSLVYPFAEYRRAATNATLNIREAYVCRNPLTVEGRRRRHLIGTLELDQFPIHAIRSTALGQLLMGVTGSGKTTFGGCFAAPYLKLIEHSEYRGTPYKCRQIPMIAMAVSHDATLQSFCLQFFEIIDSILGNTHYLHEAKTARNIAKMALLLHRVSTAVSLGEIFVDDLQHLRAARSGQAEIVLNLFSQIIEIAGVSMMFSATPALEPVIANSVRNIRKLTSGGTSNFPVMGRHDPQWIALCEAHWPHQLVRHPCKLTPLILDAWHDCSGGNPAFTTMSFALAQRQEIGGRETIDELSFQRVAETEMCILRPAIKALLSGNAADLSRFDDLVFKSELRGLRELIGWSDAPNTTPDDNTEFDELEEARTSETKSKPKSAPRVRSATSKGLPVQKGDRELPVVRPVF